MKQFFFCLVLLAILPSSLVAQRFNKKDSIKITLSDSTLLVFLPTLTTKKQKARYYFLPTNLRVSERDSTKEFSLLTYDLNKDGEIDGGIIHLLLTWGLTNNQMKEAKATLRTTVNSSAVIWGAVPLQALETASFSISSSDLGDLLNLGLANGSGVELAAKIPITPGEKWAGAFRFTGAETEKLTQLLRQDDALKNTFIELGFEFQSKPIKLRSSLFDLLKPLL